MAPVCVPEIRISLARHTRADCAGLAELALTAADGRAARQAVANAVR